MIAPFIVWLIIFKFIPLWGWTMAFQNLQVKDLQKSFFERPWNGLGNFVKMFSENEFKLAMRNTIAMSVLGITFGFFFSITFALLLNELRSAKFKKAVQTMSYLPHFVSWAVVASIVTTVLGTSGILNNMLVGSGIISSPIEFFTNPKLFWFTLAFVNVWKETGWDAIIYLSAMAGIDQELYDAAKVDGAGRFKRMWHITLPGIRPTIIVLLIMSIGGLLNVGMERQMLLGNNLVYDYSVVLDYHAYRYGIGKFMFGYGTAVGVFKSLIAVFLLFFANRIAKKFDENALV